LTAYQEQNFIPLYMAYNPLIIKYTDFPSVKAF